MLASSLLYVLGCTKVPEVAPVEETTISKEYLIRKGNHFSDGSLLEWMDTQAISCVVEFDSSAMYTSAHASNQADVNKLVGFSDCGDTHHKNSARIGWSWMGKGVMLYAYCYVNGERIMKSLTTVPIHSPIRCSVAASGGYYRFNINNTIDSIPRYCGSYTGSRYKLFPYFGGDESAPHDIRIKITMNQTVPL